MVLTVTLTGPLPQAATPPPTLHSTPLNRSEGTHRVTSSLRHCGQHGTRLRGGNPGISSHAGSQRIGSAWGADLKTYETVPCGNLARKSKWDRDRCGQSGKALRGKQNLDLEHEPLGSSRKGGGPWRWGEVGGSYGETLIGQRAREAGTRSQRALKSS